MEEIKRKRETGGKREGERGEERERDRERETKRDIAIIKYKSRGM